MPSSPLTAHAATLNFYYSFSNVIGNVAGTVSGEIFGLTNNTTSSATNITVTSYPPALTGLPPATFNVTDYAASLGQIVDANSFTVTNGVVTDAVYQIYGGYFDINLQPGPGAPFYNELYNPAGSLGVVNIDGLSGVTFVAATPLPTTWTMLIAGLVGLGFMAHRGSKQLSAASGQA